MIDGEYYTPDKAGMLSSPGDGADDERSLRELCDEIAELARQRMGYLDWSIVG